MLTLLDHLEKLVILTGKKGLTESYFEKAAEHIQAVSGTLNVSAIQAIIFAHFMNLCDDQSISMSQIASSLNCSKIQLVKYMNEFDELTKRKLIRCCRSNNDTPSYRVPMEVISAVRKGIEYKPEKKENLTIEEFFEELEDFFPQRSSRELSFDSLFADLMDLANDNWYLKFTQTLRWYKLDYCDTVLLQRFCDLFINNNDDEISAYDSDGIFENNHTFHTIERLLKSGKHHLMEIGLIENVNNNEMADTQYFRLSDKAKENLLGELQIPVQGGRFHPCRRH